MKVDKYSTTLAGAARKSGVAIAATAVFFLLHPGIAVASDRDATNRAHEEMREALGKVPSFIEAYPTHLQAPAWEWIKGFGSENAALPAKYRELIAIAVAAQVPCDYCVYAHVSWAEMAGASQAEISEALAMAGYIRHWSTVLNGLQMDLEEFKGEFDVIIAHMEEAQSADE